MCVKEIFAESRPDGRFRTWSEGDFCDRAVYGQYCDRTQELRHPVGFKRTEPRTPAYNNNGQFPPTPPLSYHSDHTSDSERSSKRRSGIYISDYKLSDINKKRSSRHERQGSGERVVYVNSSPSLRTPPRYQRSSIPSSPVTDSYEPFVDERERPISSPSRPSIKVEIVNERPKSHHRHGSSSKTSSSRDSSEEERRRRRDSDLHRGEQHRQRKKDSEIAKQNEAIANRTPVPHVPTSSRYRRGSVTVAPLVLSMERMRIEEDKTRRRQEKKEADAREREEEAQKQRLRDRQLPRRSNTLTYGPSSYTYHR